MLRKGRIAAAQPFQSHRRVFLLLVAVLLEHATQILGVELRMEELERELMEHINLENNLLFPRALAG